MKKINIFNKYIIRLLVVFLILHSNSSQILFAQVKCCCGNPRKMDFPGLDFELAPAPPIGGFINYPTGSFLGDWFITSGAIDHVDKNHGFNTAYGNPNGPSNYVDLFGSPGTPGTMIYPLTGLTPGFIYSIEFYYAKFNFSGRYSANLSIANGAWLNVNWNAGNPGNSNWLKASYNFTAQTTNANLQFKDISGSIISGNIGVLIDDIKIFECPGDLEKPMVINPPEDVEVSCEKNVPQTPTLMFSDNCDLNPKVSFTENKEIISPCNKKITRIWRIEDACGNINSEDQIIDIIDKNPPQYVTLPENKTVYCEQDVIKEFNNWIKLNGNAIAIDECDQVNWKQIISHVPNKYCDSVKIQFIAIDQCGQENEESAYFIVRDTLSPRFIIKPQNKNIACKPSKLDSLNAWLKNYGYSSTTSDCDTVMMSYTYDGDITKNPIIVIFYAADRCGNKDSSMASFIFRTGQDTLQFKDYSCNYIQYSKDTVNYKSNGCDSTVIIERIKLNTDTTRIIKTTCDPNQKILDTINLSNEFGCDSIIFLQYRIEPIKQSIIKEYDCLLNFYKRDTMVLLGQYCDSLVINEHIPLKKDIVQIEKISCDTSLAGNTTYQLVNIFGCDSIVTINTIYQAQQITTLVSRECGLMQSYLDTLTLSAAHCDSLIITEHIGMSIDSITVQGVTCDSKKAGIFTSKYINQLGCDSVVIEIITLQKMDLVNIVNTTCNLNSVGQKTETLKNQFGCDSIIETTTIFIPSDTNQIILYTCDVLKVGIDTIRYATNLCDSILIFDYKYKTGDTFYINQYTCDISKTKKDTILLKNNVGCDSIIYNNTHYRPLKIEYDIDSVVCYNASNGIIKILNSNEYKEPYDLFVNGIRYTNEKEISNLSAGKYDIYIKDQRNCYSDSLQIILNNPPELVTELGHEMEIERGARIKLNLQSNRNLVNIYWQPIQISNCIKCKEIDFKVDQDTWVYSVAIDERGCMSLDSIYIRIKKSRKVYVPNVFSPNGDNINDYFYIQGEEGGIVASLYIYDRWGERVFESFNKPINDLTYGWDGTFNSKKLLPGVFLYYAVVKTDKENIELAGEITLLK